MVCLSLPSIGTDRCLPNEIVVGSYFLNLRKCVEQWLMIPKSYVFDRIAVTDDIIIG